MPYGYSTLNSTSDAQFTAADNSAAISVTLPTGQTPTGMLLSVVTTDVWVTFGASTPSATKGHTIKKDTQPVFLPFAKPFKFLPTSAAAAAVNVTWLFN